MANERTLLQILNANAVDWDEFLARHSGHPDEGVAVALSVRRLLARRPPPPVVQSLIDAHRDLLFPGRPKRGPQTRLGGAECTLLHEACLTEQSSEVLQIILDADLSAASTEYEVTRSLPLHFASDADAVRMLIEAFPRGVCSADRWGNLPLHSAVIHDKPVEVVRLLLLEGRERKVGGKAGGGGALVRSKVGERKTPLDLAGDAVSGLLDDRGTPTLDADRDELNRRWEVLSLLAQEASDVLTKKGNRRPVPFSLVHTVIEMGCHTNVVRRAISLDPAQLSLRDGVGRTPLLVAASRQGGVPMSMFDALLDTSDGSFGFPGAAHMADDCGRLPLHVTAGAGRAFREGGVEAVMEAEPDALRTRDLKSGLFPFMVPGCGTDASFQLLRAEPSVLQVYIPKITSRKRKRANI